ncbi:MAG: lipopolysaccharide heptosyltransferase family protein [Bacteroidetes bacterium]|nr:MAG: lipopolysaccharide heptosyltransferase family protein [Bacteroidota bacterium]
MVYFGRMKIIISRTDNLGDVVLTLPLAGFLKEQNPEATIYFVGKGYTRPLITCSSSVDVFLDREELLQNPQRLADLQADAILFVFPDKDIARIAQQARIPLRIGTSHRWWHWLYANKMVSFSRRKSELHEAQLNFKLLEPLGYHVLPTFSAITHWYGLQPPALPTDIQAMFLPDRPHIVLHPKSKGSAREWGVEKFYQVALQCPEKQFFITGIAHEGELIKAEKPAIFALPNVIDLTGKVDLATLIALIARADALVSASTGPLHIASALGIKAIGIYPPMKPIHPARWQPIGRQVKILVLDKNCNDCEKKMPCHCMEAISVGEVIQSL